MNTFLIREFHVSEKFKCNFYTVRYDDCDISETDKFYDKYFKAECKLLKDMEIIHTLIEKIAERGMSIITRARGEGKAFALPPKEYAVRDFEGENKLRLYYVELSSNIIVLLGGGLAHDDYGKPSIELMHAQTFAKKIFENSDSYILKDGFITPLENEKEIIIL